MTTENNEKKHHDRVELSVDELEGAAGGYASDGAQRTVNIHKITPEEFESVKRLLFKVKQ